MQRDCENLSNKFEELSDKAKQQGVWETSGFTESVHLFLDLIIAYQDLCERRERTVQRKHQKALAKVQTMVNYKERIEATGKHVVSLNPWPIMMAHYLTLCYNLYSQRKTTLVSLR